MMIYRTLLFPLFLAAFVTMAGTTVKAQPTAGDAGAFITGLGDRTVSYLASQTASPQEQEQWLREMMREGFALPTIGRFVIGKFQRSASPEAVDEFVKVFEDYIITFYASQFAQYSGQTFSVQGVRQTTRPQDTLVAAQIRSPNRDQPLAVEFHVREIAGTHKILDVRVEGISMVLAQREEFTSYIANNGGRVEALTDALRSRMVKITSAAQN